MSDPMAEIRASFFIECEELLEALQDGLTALDSGDHDPETINVCFRAVHSMKGGAGAFGLEKLVRFAHRYETVMDEVRKGNLNPDRGAMLLFFRAADVLSDIVRASRDGDEVDADLVESTLRDLEALTGAAPDDHDDDEVSADDFEVTGLSLDLDLDDDVPAVDAPAAPPRWVVAFAPQADLYRSGNEPLHLIRALGMLGTLEVECDLSAVPRLEDFDVDAAYLTWTLTLETERDEADIREVFDFVDGLCTLSISRSEVETPPPPAASDTSPEPKAGQAPSPAPRSRLNFVATEEPAPVAPKPTAMAEQDDDGDDAPTPARTAPPASSGPAPARQPQQATAPKATVRVDLDRVDRLVNLVGELVINQAMLSQSVTEAGLPPNSPVAQGLEEFMQLTRDIQDSVMMIRAQPVKSLFQRMSRIVREASGAVGKRVRLVSEGEATEVDKTVIERLADPLTHMIRNAVDHGLERGPDRIAAGKSEEGVVKLSAAHRSGRVIIEVSDDGGGINRPRVRQIAEDKGLIHESAQLTDTEIDNLLFLPGFSTAKEISDLSGRGVGMDVVRSAIQDLGGRITIHSVPGKGTTFSISLPLTLAVLDGMVVKSANETLVVPLGAIVETLSLQDNEIRRLGPETHVLHVRDSFVPLLDLGAELGYRGPLRNYEGHVVLLITQEDGTRAALIVDSIEEQRQVVIKGLQDSYGHVPGIAAATILGDGQVALILDPVDLMAKATGRTGIAAADLDLTA